MKKKKVFVFGNPDIEMDSLPIKLLPQLRYQFPDFDFVVLDPNEEWEVSESMTVIDTVIGIDSITIFHDLTAFMSAPRLSCHDFDAYANMRLLQKIGKLSSILIIGVPPRMDEQSALEGIIEHLARLR